MLWWGSFIRVPEPLYYRLDHAGNYHKQWFDWPKERKRASWTTLFTGLLEATMPVCTTPEERLFFQQFILRSGNRGPAGAELPLRAEVAAGLRRTNC